MLFVEVEEIVGKMLFTRDTIGKKDRIAENVCALKVENVQLCKRNDPLSFSIFFSSIHLLNMAAKIN